MVLALTPRRALPRLQKEIEVLENAGPLTTATGEGTAAPSPAEDQKTEVALDSRQVRRWCPAQGVPRTSPRGRRRPSTGFPAASLPRGLGPRALPPCASVSPAT